MLAARPEVVGPPLLRVPNPIVVIACQVRLPAHKGVLLLAAEAVGCGGEGEGGM